MLSFLQPPKESFLKDFLDCKAYPNTTGNLRITVADVLDTNGATKVKAFLWESLETFAPVCDFIEWDIKKDSTLCFFVSIF